MPGILFGVVFILVFVLGMKLHVIDGAGGGEYDDDVDIEDIDE